MAKKSKTQRNREIWDHNYAMGWIEPLYDDTKNRETRVQSGKIVYFASRNHLDSRYSWDVEPVDGNPNNSKISNLRVIHRAKKEI